jgi:hypothetical protein
MIFVFLTVLMCLRDEKSEIRMAVLELIHKLVTDRSRDFHTARLSFYQCIGIRDLVDRDLVIYFYH